MYCDLTLNAGRQRFWDEKWAAKDVTEALCLFTNWGSSTDKKKSISLFFFIEMKGYGDQDKMVERWCDFMY